MDINAMLSGAIATAALVIALFFLRFWKSTGDRFFIYFALSFALEAALRLVMGLTRIGSDDSAAVYLVRLVSYCLILVAILGKNRRQASAPPGPSAASSSAGKA